MATKKKPDDGVPVILMFTGAAGGTSYCYGPDQVLQKGETIELRRPLPRHWTALIRSGNAEVL